MKTLKQHINDNELEDFEEDLIGDKKPVKEEDKDSLKDKEIKKEKV